MEFSYNANNGEVPVAYATFRAMNTVMEILMVHVPEQKARRLCERSGEIVSAIEGKLSRHLPESMLSAINTCAGKRAVELDEEACTVLQLCEVMRRATGGYFDIAALSATRQRPVYTVDHGNRTAKPMAGPVVLDAGGFAKGYALDKIKKELRDSGVGTALLNFGNSSVMALGTHPLGDSWRIASTGGVEYRLRDGSLSVSGKTPGGKLHIVDPQTGTMPDRNERIAVQGTSALVCEILSTGLYAAPEERRAGVIADFPGYGFNIEKHLPINRWTEGISSNSWA